MKAYNVPEFTGGSCAANGEMIQAGDRLQTRLTQELNLNSTAAIYRLRIVATAMMLSCANGPGAVVGTISLIADDFVAAAKCRDKKSLRSVLTAVLRKYQPQR